MDLREVNTGREAARKDARLTMKFIGARASLIPAARVKLSNSRALSLRTASEGASCRVTKRE